MNEPDKFGCFFLVVILLIFSNIGSCAIGEYQVSQLYKNEAVERDYGHWETDSYGWSTFKWNTDAPPKPIKVEKE